jgi:hypothetical protein
VSLVQQLFERDGRHLRLRTIYLREMAASVGDGFDPLVAGQKMTGQMRKLPSTCALTEFVDTDSVAKPGYIFSTRFEFRYVLEDDPTRLAGVVAATIATCYFIDDGAELNEQQQMAWGESSALFHAWPYWREYAHAALARLNLPVTLMPMLDIQAAIANADDGTAAVESIKKAARKSPSAKKLSHKG